MKRNISFPISKEYINSKFKNVYLFKGVVSLGIKSIRYVWLPRKFLSTISPKEIDAFFDMFNSFIANFEFQVFASSVEAQKP